MFNVLYFNQVFVKHANIRTSGTVAASYRTQGSYGKRIVGTERNRRGVP